MRLALGILLAFVLAAPVFSGSRRIHRQSDDHSETTIVFNDDEAYASWTRNGVRYETRDRSVMQAIERAMEKHREISHEHRDLGRRHRDLGREHARLGREHARIGRMHARGDHAAEAAQQQLELRQRELDERQDELEREQDALEARSRVVQRQVDRAVEEIFARAVREGKAKRK